MKGTMLLVPLLGAAALWLLPSRASPDDGKNVDWPNYGNDLHNTRFQAVDQINTSNEKKLEAAWVFHTGVLDPLAELQVSPIIVDGRMFVTDGHDDVFALDAATGQTLWKYTANIPKKQITTACCGFSNRGVAIGDGKVFVEPLEDAVRIRTGERGDNAV